MMTFAPRPLAGEGAFDLRDDAGVLDPPPGTELVVTTDMVARDVHFLRDPPDTIAKKALRVNLSDLAAKGATPLAYVLNLALSPEIDETWLKGFAEGLREDQAHYGVWLLGGGGRGDWACQAGLIRANIFLKMRGAKGGRQWKCAGAIS